MAELQFRDTAAAGYDRSVGEMTRRIVPVLLRAVRLAPGQRVLDIATGTGFATEAIAAAIGLSGHLVAADISPALLAKARERLGGCRTSPSRSRRAETCASAAGASAPCCATWG